MVVLEIHLDERLPVERILDGLHLAEHVTLEVELLRDAQLLQVLRHIALAVEEQAVPFLEVLAREVQAWHVVERRRPDMLAAAVVRPAMQWTRDRAPWQR